MRSKVFSIALVLLALSSGSLAVLHFSQKSLSSLLGQPAVPVGDRLLQFQASTTRGIEIETPKNVHRYEEVQGQWLLKTKTGRDRADYRTLEALLAFSTDLTILESLPNNAKNRKAMGLSPASAKILLKSKTGKTQAQFSIGHKGAWQRFIAAADAYSKPQNWPSIYILPAESDFIYLCSSSYLEDILRNGFGSQRDLRPFFFPPELLAEVSITRPNGTLVLARKSPVAPWKIQKPFELDADPDAAAKLTAGLYQLTALEAKNKPAPSTEDPSLQIAIRFFSLNGTIHEVPIALSLTESKNKQEKAYLGRLNDWRKSIEFLLPSDSLNLLFRSGIDHLDTDKDGKIDTLERQNALLARFDKDGDGSLNASEEDERQISTNQLIGVDELPLSIDELRGANLSGLDLRQLKKLTFDGPELDGPMELEISRSAITGEWQVQRNYQGATTKANEFTFFSVKKILSEEEALDTISDSVADLSEYGLDTPILTLTLQLFDGTTEQIRFGESISEDGIPHFFFFRNDSNTVMEVESEDYYNLATRPYQWRAANIWNFSIFDLTLLQLERSGHPPLSLTYSDLAQTWSARLGQKDVTSLLNENRANRYLENLEGITANRWLGPEHEPAAQALLNPVFNVTAFFKRPDQTQAPIESKVLSIARPNRNGKTPFYYGKIENDPHYFILDLATVQKLAQTVLEEE